MTENLSLSELLKVTQENFDQMGKIMHVPANAHLLVVPLLPVSLDIKNVQQSLQLQEVCISDGPFLWL